MQSFLDRSRFSPEQIQPHQTILANGTRVSVIDAGIIEFVPANYQPSETRHVVLSCGVHGNETAPIEMCSDLVEGILNQSIIPQVKVQFQFANLAAMNIGERFVDHNMNRLFDGAHHHYEPGPETRRAAQLEQCTRTFFAECGHRELKFHYDLHTAIRDAKYPRFAVYPYIHGKPYSRQQINWLASAGIQAILLSHNPTTTYSYYTSKHCDAHAFTVELGKVRAFGHNNRADFASSFEFLKHLLMDNQFNPECDDSPIVFDIAQTVRRETEDFELHFADDTPNFTAFDQGYNLATAYSQSGKKEYPVLAKKEAIVFPNADVAIGQRALLTVVEIDLHDLELI